LKTVKALKRSESMDAMMQRLDRTSKKGLIGND